MPPSCVSRARPPGIPRRPPPHRSSPPGMATVPCSDRTATASFRESRSERQRAAAPILFSPECGWAWRWLLSRTYQRLVRRGGVHSTQLNLLFEMFLRKLIGPASTTIRVNQAGKRTRTDPWRQCRLHFFLNLSSVTAIASIRKHTHHIRTLHSHLMRKSISTTTHRYEIASF